MVDSIVGAYPCKMYRYRFCTGGEAVVVRVFTWPIFFSFTLKRNLAKRQGGLREVFYYLPTQLLQLSLSVLLFLHYSAPRYR